MVRGVGEEGGLGRAEEEQENVLFNFLTFFWSPVIYITGDQKELAFEVLKLGNCDFCIV